MILLKNISSWSLPDVFEIPFKIVIYFLLIASLDKFEFGLINIAMMIFSYQALSQIGVVDWLLYELPKRYALNLDMDSLIKQSYSFVLINQIFLMILVVLSIIYFDEGSGLFRFACGVYILHTMLYNSYLHRKLYLRFNHRFARLMNVQLTFVVSKFVLQLGSLYFFGIYGFLLIEAVIYLIPIYLLKSDIDFKLYDPKWFSNYTKLVVQGFPFFVVILMSTILGNLDKWYIVGYFGVEKFATYSVGAFLIAGIMIFPGKVLSVFIQYMKEMYVVDKNVALNIDRNFSVNNILLYLLVSLVLVLNSLTGYINIFLPKYEDVSPLMGFFLLSGLLKYCVSLTSNNLYLLGRKVDVAKAQIFIAICYAFILALNAHYDTPMIFVILSMSCVLCLQIMINLVMLITFEKVERKLELIKFLALIFGATSYFYVDAYVENGIPMLFCLVFVNLVFFWRANRTWHNFKYIATREFSS
jgi:O-antigen/teichoic acid export membrane protein